MLSNHEPNVRPRMVQCGSSSYLLLAAGLFIALQPYWAAAVTYNVARMGARGDGRTESTKAFLDAWEAACSSHSPATIYVPPGRYYLRNLIFSDCKNNDITFKIDGTLVAPSDYRFIGNTEDWIAFHGVTGVSIIGGVLDGQGTGLWTCKTSRKGCPTGATTLGFTRSSNIYINALTSLNSQMFHIVINGCSNVKLEWVRVYASGLSPNTDGIHVQQSSGVTIMDSQIKTGDDCISVGPGTTHLWIERVACGPGHGISIGSLGWDLEEDGVENVTVKAVIFRGSQNGVRIKTWAKPSDGFVNTVVFQNISMFNVHNPIIIDQNYCPEHGCPRQASGVKVRDVTYKDIRGTSASEVAVNFDCSGKNPCTEIKLQDVQLSYYDAAAQSSCSHANGMTSGIVQPSSCLS